MDRRLDQQHAAPSSAICTAPFAERTIVHGGKQSMPFEYNNVKTPFYSEAEREFSPVANWTVNGADTLSLWVRGNPVAYVAEGDKVTMSAAGHDIWDNADDFRFACKSLTGNGSVVVRVESLVNTNAWAKAGVMIRQSLDADSKMAYMIVSYSSGVSFGWRQQTAGTCGSVTQAGVAAPQWVKLTRTGDAFTAQYSADGKTWTDIKNTDGTVASTTVAMTGPVYIGLCVTSHNAGGRHDGGHVRRSDHGQRHRRLAGGGDRRRSAAGQQSGRSVRRGRGQRRQEGHGDRSDAR